MNIVDVAIVGAGAAGISAGLACRRQNLSSVILEASQVPGGRAKSIQIDRNSVFDLGAHWLHSPAHNPLVKLTRETGVAVSEDALTAITSFDGRRLSPLEARACDASIKLAFSAMNGSPDIAVSNFSKLAGEWSPAFDAAFEIKQGTHPSRASSLDFASYIWDGDDLPVTGGFGTVIARLAGQLPIQLASPVRKIDYSRGDRVELSGVFGSLEARHVIITVSTGVLASGAIAFQPALPPATEAAIGNLPLGSCNKIAIAFSDRGAFGSETGLQFTPYGKPSEPVEFVIFEAQSNLVVMLVHGSFGKELAEAGSQAMRSYALSALSSVFGSGAVKSAGPSHTIADWDSDPLVKGYVATALPGCASARNHLKQAVDGRLHFAGEATSSRYMGDLHGAWLEGEAAVTAIAQMLNA